LRVFTSLSSKASYVPPVHEGNWPATLGVARLVKIASTCLARKHDPTNRCLDRIVRSVQKTKRLRHTHLCSPRSFKQTVREVDRELQHPWIELKVIPAMPRALSGVRVDGAALTEVPGGD